jgi:hypothetical protein
MTEIMEKTRYNDVLRERADWMLSGTSFFSDHGGYRPGTVQGEEGIYGKSYFTIILEEL